MIIDSKMKWNAINKAYMTNTYWYIISKNDKNPKIVSAENIIIDPRIITIEWVASPYSDTRILVKEGWL